MIKTLFAGTIVFAAVAVLVAVVVVNTDFARALAISAGVTVLIALVIWAVGHLWERFA